MLKFWNSSLFGTLRPRDAKAPSDLLLVELHSIPTQIASKNIGTTLCTPYDATHGYTDQYIIELECFLNAAKHAGLQPLTNYSFSFPNREKATVSIHLLKAN